MKKKKMLFLIIAILLIVIIAIITFLIIKNNSSKENESNNTTSIQDEYNPNLPVTTLTSTSENPIKKDDIEATKIILINNFGELELETTLKNNSNEEINGFFIQIDFLDENGNTLTSISNNSQDVIDAKGELIMRNTISGLESDINIKSAKISYFEKNTVQENIENSMTEIEDSVEE